MSDDYHFLIIFKDLKAFFIVIGYFQCNKRIVMKNICKSVLEIGHLNDEVLGKYHKTYIFVLILQIVELEACKVID